MKTILTQNTLILLIAAFAVILAFTACSDVVSPGDVNEELSLQTESAEMQEMRRRAARTTSGGEAVTSCTLQDQIITYGGNGESIQQRIANGKNVGTISLSIADGKITITAKVDDPTVWLIDKTDLEIAKNPTGNFPGGPGSFTYSNTHNPHVAEFSYTVTLSDHSIVTGDEFYVAMHVNVNGQQAVNGSGDESSWGGEEDGPGNRKYFKVTNTCPAAGAFNAAG